MIVANLVDKKLPQICFNTDSQDVVVQFMSCVYPHCPYTLKNTALPDLPTIDVHVDGDGYEYAFNLYSGSTK